ncbi:MAG: hypothetical protein U1E29_10525 [Coriobacteriia bacterium]|nr:hypothetical protein [Coriobacteriia bacterium]
MDVAGLKQLSLAVEHLLEQDSFGSTVMRLRSELARSTEAFVWSTLELSSLPFELPEEIKSAWVFHLRRDVPSGCHYHPNSVQHMVVVSGQGQASIGGQCRDTAPFGSSSSVTDEWLIIDRGVPHEFIPAGDDITVVSFHTCAADELEEIGCDTGSARHYEAADA